MDGVGAVVVLEGAAGQGDRAVLADHGHGGAGDAGDGERGRRAVGGRAHGEQVAVALVLLDDLIDPRARADRRSSAHRGAVEHRGQRLDIAVDRRHRTGHRGIVDQPVLVKGRAQHMSEILIPLAPCVSAIHTSALTWVGRLATGGLGRRLDKRPYRLLRVSPSAQIVYTTSNIIQRQALIDRIHIKGQDVSALRILRVHLRLPRARPTPTPVRVSRPPPELICTGRLGSAAFNDW